MIKENCSVTVADLPELKWLRSYISEGGEIVVWGSREQMKVNGQAAIDEGKPVYILYEDGIEEFIAKRVAGFLRKRNKGKIVQSEFWGQDAWSATDGREFVCLTPVDAWIEQRKSVLRVE